ncbi:unnamed protein product [Schistosoma margrebowiei]|uniref:Uncharacterized protein n=1 Tax=Schistosoma margrebowiei TaxID=48269 RepID=A0A3P7YKR0_9TREM|nr:unnamed protein product [Schistosoma margrebowiei]
MDFLVLVFDFYELNTIVLNKLMYSFLEIYFLNLMQRYHYQNCNKLACHNDKITVRKKSFLRTSCSLNASNNSNISAAVPMLINNN